MSNDWLEGRLQSAFLIYQTWNALNLHFNNKRANYDYFKYSGKTNLKYESFVKSDNAKFAMRWINIGKEHDLEKVFFSILKEGNVWFGTYPTGLMIQYRKWLSDLETIMSVGDYADDVAVSHCIKGDISVDQLAILINRSEHVKPNNMFETVLYKKALKMVPFYVQYTK